MPQLSVIIPSFNTPENHLTKLYETLINQDFQDFEVIISDDCSNFDFYHIIKDSRFKIVKTDKNGGPAKARNLGAENATSDRLFFTDSDCSFPKDTLSQVMKGLESDEIVMGNTVTQTETVFGKAVAYLGFPGGGNIGFENVWHVDERGYTDSISSCNLAIRKDIFQKNGMFDTSFPVPGGEDTYFAKKTIAQNGKIRYNRYQTVFHVERGSFRSFLKWQITRGRGNFHIKRKLGSVGGFYKLRLWSFKNSLLKSGFYFPLVAFLIVVSFLWQKKGYNIEKKSCKEIEL